MEKIEIAKFRKPDEAKIKNIKQNLFYRSQASIDNYENFVWHQYSDKHNSSQALAIDFWGCLKNSPLKVQIINMLFGKDCESWKISLEYTDKSLMSEIIPTQIDILFENEHHAIIIESKFKEREGGSCSQTKGTKDCEYQCDGNYKSQTNRANRTYTGKSKCALTGKGIKYWDFISTLTTFDKNETYVPCPFKGEEFQWMRNICFTEAYSKKNNKKGESYLVYYKSNKCPISKKINDDTYLGKLKGNILNPQSFQPLAYNDLLENVINFLNAIDINEQRVWLELKKWMSDKESKLLKNRKDLS